MSAVGTEDRQKKKRKRAPILRWRGVLAEAPFVVRMTIAIVLVVSCAALSFTQLGFAGVGLSGQFLAYAVVLLLPIALAGLLLGTLVGTVIGLAAGALLYAHAITLPLDYYELAFITPASSIGLLTITGFMMCILFAFVLRKDPPAPRRFIYVIIVCTIASVMFSQSFAISVFIELVNDLANSGVNELPQETLEHIARENAGRMVLRLGNVGLQMMLDAALMSVLCCIADHVARWQMGRKRVPHIRAVFNIWLFVVVAIAFMVISGLSFISVTNEEYNDADSTMHSEVNYLCNQLEDSSRRVEILSNFLKDAGVDLVKLDQDDFDRFADSISVKELLKGYTAEEDGSVFILSPDYDFDDDTEEVESEGYLVALSADERFVVDKPIEDFVDSDVVDAIELSAETGTTQRVIDDNVRTAMLESDELPYDDVRTRIAYVLAKDTESLRVCIMMPAEKVFKDRSDVMLWSTISSLVMLLAVFSVVAMLLDRVVVRRIDETNGVLARITEGDLAAHVDVRNTTEFESLSDGINDTVVALKGWIAEAASRMDTELATAKAIQESALPRTFPPYPDIMKFDIYAVMNAAREVGGDFYDFFLIGDDMGASSGKLGFVIADVSGKGVPAALFMMKANTQIRDYLESGMEVGEAIENANRQLCDGNDAGMFVTVWVGVLDYATGHVDYVNAGHNPPLLWQDGSWRMLTEKSGLPLGLFDGVPYTAHHVDCQIGDQFLLYTDGVTEAMDVDGNLYGEDRLDAVAGQNYVLHPRPLVEAVRRDVARFAEGAEQSDDITILALEIGVPPEITATLVVPADVNELPAVNEFIHTELDRRLCPLRAQKQIDIAVEELFVNVCHYAYPDASPDCPGLVRVSYTYSAEPPSVRIDIADTGIPYNPLAKPDAVTPDDIMDVPIGGLGILMAKRSVDDMSYERVNDSNIVSIEKKW